jgi:hypothetical protein
MQNYRSVQIAILVITKVMSILLWNGPLHLKVQRGRCVEKSACSQVEEESSICTDNASQRKVSALVMW